MTQSDTTTKLYQAISAQPEAVRTLLTDWDGPTQAAQRLAGGGRVLLAGIGTSYHAAIVGEYLLRLAGCDAWAVRSFEFVNYPLLLRPTDSVIVLSHRGSKQHSVGALQRAVAEHIFTVGITGKHSQMQGAQLILETVEQDPSPTHSISYTTALTRLAQIATRLAALQARPQQAQQLEQNLAHIPSLMESILRRVDTLRHIAADVVTAQRRIYFLGAGPNAATAPEGALKAKEASYVTAEGFELEQAIHGPLISFEANDLIIPISVPGPAQARMADLLLGLSEINPQLLLLGDAPNAETAALLQRPHWTRFALTEDVPLLEELTPMLAALPVQLLANFLATARGTDPDSFRRDSAIYKRANERFSL
jgi:glucosamine--fructose-6-phosphate aminotransferase (isomerizing)